MSVKPIPEGYHSVTPYLIVKGAAQALEFYKRAFGAVETVRLDGPDGMLAHAEFKIGDSHVMLSDEWPHMDALGPVSRGGTSVGLAVYTEDCDAMFDRAVAAGGTAVRPVQNQFYGDRSGTLKDPFGHQWTIATHVEDVSPEEMQSRMESAMKGQP
ncbi:MAG: VOC family protein [Planctomycetota bacterium]|nr:VOC family protein [Planctomycetaceae bacterium]MDQ3329087.1 VOC family protein [Planctomycetota bacterium]